MRAILLGPCLGGSGAEWKRVLRKVRVRKADYRLGVDGGVLSAKKLKLKLDAAIGDWDGLRSRSYLRGLDYQTLPRDKDESDLAAALRFLKSRDIKEVVGLGFIGGRLDHEIANLYEWARFKGRVTVLSPGCELRFLGADRKRESLKLKKGQIFSVLPLQGSARGVSIQGADFPLKDKTLRASSHGLSNRARSPKVVVSLKGGVLVVVIQEES